MICFHFSIFEPLETTDLSLSIVNQQITQQIKKEMLFLQRYAEELRLHSVLYEEDGRHLQIEDELVDYLHYTRSVLDLRNDCKTEERASLKSNGATKFATSAETKS